MTDLSIIVPVYNGEQYLAQLLDSICAICCTTIEVVMVNDGSSDGSENIIKKYQEKDSRIKYFPKENGGIVSARNYGLERAIGKYLFFADQDDKVDAHTIEKAIQRLEEEKADMLLFSTEHFNDIGRQWPCDTVYEDGSFDENEIADLFIRKLVTRYTKKEVVSYLGHIWAAIIRRDMVQEQGIHFKRFMAIEDDLLFVLDSLDYSKKLLTMKESGYYWRQNPSSRTRRSVYCENMADKKKLYYEYRTDVLKRHGVCTEEEFRDYCIGVRQEFMLDMLDNEAILGIKSIVKSEQLLKNYLEDLQIKEAMQSKPMCPLARRYSVEMKLLMQSRCKSALLYKKLKYAKSSVGNWMRRKRHEI